MSNTMKDLLAEKAAEQNEALQSLKDLTPQQLRFKADQLAQGFHLSDDMIRGLTPQLYTGNLNLQDLDMWSALNINLQDAAGQIKKVISMINPMKTSTITLTWKWDTSSSPSIWKREACT
jgi:hypothetical protein